MGTLERQKAVIEEFSRLTAWEDRYKRIIALGRALKALPENEKSEDLKVRGCQSQVWLKAYMNDQKRVEFQADSDALLVKGLIALLLQIYSEATPEEILSTPPNFIRKLGFDTNLSPTRSNGLFAMIRQIMYYATAFKTLNS